MNLEFLLNFVRDLLCADRPVVDGGRRAQGLAGDPELRSLAGGVYASFLIPGVMSLGAQIGGENKLVWRSVFAIAALVGMYFTTRLLTRILKSGQGGGFARSRWLVILLYLLVLVLGVWPNWPRPPGWRRSRWKPSCCASSS